MNIAKFTHDGITYENVPVDGLAELGLSEQQIASLVLAQTKSDLQVQLLELHAAALRTMTGDATLEENLTWTPKEKAAQAFIAGTASDAERGMIEAEANITGEDVTELAQLITSQKNHSYPVIGKLSGLRRKARDAINGSGDLDAVNAAFLAFTNGIKALAVAASD